MMYCQQWGQICVTSFCLFSKQFRTEDRLWRDRWPYTTITRITLMDIAATVEWVKWAPRIRNARRILGITNTMTPYRDMSIRMRGKSIRCQQISRRKTIKLSKRKLNPRLFFSLRRYGQDDEDRQWDSGGKRNVLGSTYYENKRNRKTLPQRPASSIGIHRPDYRPTVTRQRSYESDELDYKYVVPRYRIFPLIPISLQISVEMRLKLNY